MSEPMIIPAEFQRAFHRLMNRVTSEDRNDPELQKSILVYLKLGGESLARHCIEISKKKFPDQTIILKKQFREEALDTEESEDANTDEGHVSTDEDDTEDDEFESEFDDDIEDSAEI
ncbi:MAG: hypothetical protein WA151_01300 [Desulfatirhabdiaceae bacterium]